MLALAAAAVHPAVEGGAFGGTLAVVGAIACVFLVVGLLGRWAPLVQLALSVVVLEYAGFLLYVREVDGRAPLVAAALLLSGELAYTSLEPPARRTWPVAVGLGLGAAAVGVLLLGVAGLGAGGLPYQLAGVAAAAAALALLARLAVVSGRRV